MLGNENDSIKLDDIIGGRRGFNNKLGIFVKSITLYFNYFQILKKIY